VRNVGRQNVPERAACMVAESVQGSVEGCAAFTEGNNSRGNTVDRTEVGVARPAVANGLIAHAIFLFAKGKTNDSAGHEIGIRAGHGVQGAGPNPQADVAQAKQGPARGVAGRTQVLAWAQEKVKPKDQALSGSHRGES
jgi:hypothetical protein